MVQVPCPPCPVASGGSGSSASRNTRPVLADERELPGQVLGPLPVDTKPAPVNGHVDCLRGHARQVGTSRYSSSDSSTSANTASGRSRSASRRADIRPSRWYAVVNPTVSATTGVLTKATYRRSNSGRVPRIVMLSVAFRFWSMIAARALAGVGDTRTPMYVRLLTLPTNIILNAVLTLLRGRASPGCRRTQPRQRPADAR